MAMSSPPYYNDHRLLRFPERIAPRRLTVSNESAADYASIQDAINHANAGDTIVLDAGMYFESLVIDKLVHLVGPNDPRFTDEEVGAGDDSCCAMIISVDKEAIVWAADGGSIRDIAISAAGLHDDDDTTSLIRMMRGELQIRRCVLADGAHTGVVCKDGLVDIARTHIRNVAVGISVLGGKAELERVHIEGPEVVAVNLESMGGITLRDNCFEGRTMLRGTIHEFTGNDMDTLFVHETLQTTGNRVGSLVHLCAFQPLDDVAVGV